MSIENPPVRLVTALNEVAPGAEGVRSNAISTPDTGSFVAASTTRPVSRTVADAWNGAAASNASSKLVVTAIIGRLFARIRRTVIVPQLQVLNHEGREGGMSNGKTAKNLLFQ